MVTDQLTLDEGRLLSVVENHLAAIGEIIRDPTRVSVLEPLLAPGFTWQTPSEAAGDSVIRDRASYLAMLGIPDLLPEHERFVELKVVLLAATVQGRRVAGECASEGIRRDGLRYANRYHQLWHFDDDHRIVEYRIYGDTANTASVRDEGLALRVSTILDCFAASDTALAEGLLANDLIWTFPNGAGGDIVLNKSAILDQIARGRVLRPLADGTFSQSGRVIVEVEDEDGRHRVLVCLLVAGMIARVREYGGPPSERRA